MFSSTLKVAGCLVALCLIVHAQNPAQKAQSGSSSISGKVTMKGSGVPGILIGARQAQQSPRGVPPPIATTDQQGNYKLSNLAPGQYEIVTGAPQFVLTSTEPIRRLIVGEGETIENIDFTLVRGGVITGKVVDADGKPVIDEQIEVFPAGHMGTAMPYTFTTIGTDDRGIYRIFGLAPGKYKVAAGSPEDRMTFGRILGAVYTRTYYPSVGDETKATVIEVGEGSEVTNIDITLRRTQPTFTVTARVVDAETGKPIPDATWGLEKFRENGSFATSGMPSNQQGEIKFENITPGKYALFVVSTIGRDAFSEPVHFEVVDQDIKDLVVKTSSGSSIAGTIVFEGVNEKVRPNFAEVMLYVHSMSNEDTGSSMGSAPQAMISPDGSFRVGGLRSGTLHFSIWVHRKGTANEYEVARVERDGVVVPNFEIKARDQIKNLRLIVRSRTGRIRGVLKFENGQLPGSRVYISAKRVGDENFETPLQVDDRGRFISEGLAAGVYELRVLAYGSGPLPAQAKQQVVVSDNQVSEVTLTVDLKADPRQEKP
ncbi:MAG TPA: hypothetical protein VFR51_12800 [Pyrinomonadaceae bacterium]|nr:hypothetical protein [Pyrinomonadaceae bacterium]